MDPVTPTILVEAYKAGGIVLVLLVAIGLLIYLGYKDQKARESRMSAALDACQAKGEENTKEVTTAIINNTNMMNTLCDVMRDRPCLKEPSPAYGNHIPKH
jgi:uncharacterized membrane-anchored protein YhcB (DUF1043 family)